MLRSANVTLLGIQDYSVNLYRDDRAQSDVRLTRIEGMTILSYPIFHTPCMSKVDGPVHYVAIRKANRVDRKCALLIPKSFEMILRH